MTIDKSIVSIRKMTPPDAEAISHIFELITQHKATPDNIQEMMERHSNTNSHEVNFVAETEGKVIGFIIGYILKLGFEADESAYIATMGIHPQYMGQTIGAALIEEIIKYYGQSRIKKVYTSVRWDSADLLSFFKTVEFNSSNFINLKYNLDRQTP